MIASVGSWIVGSGTSSTETLRLPCHTTAFIVGRPPVSSVKPPVPDRGVANPPWSKWIHHARRFRRVGVADPAADTGPVGRPDPPSHPAGWFSGSGSDLCSDQGQAFVSRRTLA